MRATDPHHTLLRSGRPAPLAGSLLMERRDGAPVLLDPDTGNELRDGDLPAFVLATEGEATDGNILRMHWNLGRAEAGGVPVLWMHNHGALLGVWRDVGMRDLEGGPALVARPELDEEDPEGAKRARQIRKGYLSNVSVGWRPGALTPRGDLPEDHPLYREPVEDWCGERAEGYLMGSEEQPNELFEGSLVSIGADPRAHALRWLNSAPGSLERALRGEAEDPDFDRLIARIAAHPRAAAGLERLIRAAVADALATRETPTPTNTPARTLGDLFPGVR
jgi:hypothetical protein